MSKSTGGLSRQEFNRLAQMTDREVKDNLFSGYSTNGLGVAVPYGLISNDRTHRRRFTYTQALAVEVARQWSDQNGLPLRWALHLIACTDGIQKFAELCRQTRYPSDFWIAVLSARNTWGSAPRGTWPVAGFGKAEFWADNHFTGTLGSVAGEMSEWIGRDKFQYPDSDPARIFMCNVSAADRRLRKRAAEMNITIVDDEFASA